MARVVAIHQPQYLPWLPYLAKIAQCDVFVLLDDVQYQKNGLQNRNQIKTAQGPSWLTVPVHADIEKTIAQTTLARQPWADKHVRTLAQSYARAPGLQALLAPLEPVLHQPWKSLADLNAAVLTVLLRAFSITVPVVRASSLAATGAKQDRVLAICRELEATQYLSGPGAAHYQEPLAFASLGIELQYQQYQAPSYRQCHMALGFVPDLSGIDLILNHPADAAEWLRSGLLPPVSAAQVHGS
jgi:hypothetical protein